MAHEIEADFKDYYPDEEKQCRNCTSFEAGEVAGYCSEARADVPAEGHCDFFQSRD